MRGIIRGTSSRLDGTIEHFTMEVPSRSEVLAAATWKCPKCQSPRSLFFDGHTVSQTCPNCGADALGKVHPQKRIEPKQEHVVELQPDPELDALVQSVVEQHPDAVLDFKAGKQKSLSYLLGEVRKQRPQAHPLQIKIRLEVAMKTYTMGDTSESET